MISLKQFRRYLGRRAPEIIRDPDERAAYNRNFRWFLASIALIGFLCAIADTRASAIMIGTWLLAYGAYRWMKYPSTTRVVMIRR